MSKRVAVFLLVLFCVLLFQKCQNQKQTSRVYHRSGVIAVDSVILLNGGVLLKGDTVQIVTEKSTEEGTYVRTKMDSGPVYDDYIVTLCWLKDKSEGIELRTGQIITLLKDHPYVFDRVEDGYYYVSDNERRIKVSKELIVFDNREFFEKHTK
ncbi:MAG: hypothetical protein RBG1_1C00001G0412 [candidate division Zixibacteria bacterium RBG-1]|nr:MAG: hypothetical protein RBG1_1C00001G0412 [candidate division Zixibacteria bacterium RBG-1]OGC84780.1 MAG: hypothetical protein A2V73_05665 [candidate division Zixibacteria bacterium RBG_19FT_COMBO_42_43]